MKTGQSNKTEVIEYLLNLALTKRKHYTFGRKAWSFVFHTVRLLTVVLGASTALSTLLSSGYQKQLTGFLAFFTAIVSGISSFGQFGRKLKQNRESRDKIDFIIHELQTMPSERVDTEKVLARIHKIMAMHRINTCPVGNDEVSEDNGS